MRFGSPRDYQHIIAFNNELMQKWVDVNVVIYKMHQEKTQLNSYGEAKTKIWYTGVQAPALINRGQTSPTQDMMTINIEQQSVDFSFLRNMLWEKNFYPEIGDIIEFEERYYEVNNTNEIQLWAGQESYSHALICHTHLTRKQDLQLDKPTL